MDNALDFSELSLADLKAKSPADLLGMAEELEIENASTMRKGDMMFSILKELAEEGVEISGMVYLRFFRMDLDFSGLRRRITCPGQTIFM